jgi:hypothetical protein
MTIYGDGEITRGNSSTVWHVNGDADYLICVAEMACGIRFASKAETIS